MPPAFHPDRPGLVAPVRPDPLGRSGPTPGRARGRRWRRTSPGLYVPVGTALTAHQRILEVATTLAPGSAITGWAALCWQRARWFPGTGPDGEPLPLPVSVPRFTRGGPGVLVSQEFLHPREILVVDGVPITPPVRSVAFEARYAASLGAAVVAIDMAAYDDLVSVAELREYAGELGPVTGIGRLREAVGLADENAWSPTEVTMRLVWEGARGIRPLTNVPVFDLEGRHVATLDGLDPIAGVAGEYEGSLHLLGSRRASDVRREGVVRRHGLEVVTMVSADRSDPREFLARLADAYRSAALRRTVDRAWTLTPPPWWKPTLTVEQRRALSQADRARLLAHRRAA